MIFNETLFEKERHIFTLNYQHFVNLYQLNIKHRKVHSIPNKYIRMQSVNKANLYDTSLFVINTGGDHIPSKKHYIIQRKIMQKRFPIPTKYEIINDKEIKDKYIILFYILIIKSLIIFKYKNNLC